MEHGNERLIVRGRGGGVVVGEEIINGADNEAGKFAKPFQVPSSSFNFLRLPAVRPSPANSLLEVIGFFGPFVTASVNFVHLTPVSPAMDRDGAVRVGHGTRITFHPLVSTARMSFRRFIAPSRTRNESLGLIKNVTSGENFEKSDEKVSVEIARVET